MEVSARGARPIALTPERVERAVRSPEASSPERQGRAQAVDEADVGYTEFFRAEFGQVLRTVELILPAGGRAEDVTQEAFLKILLHWDRVSRYERPDAWVRRVAVRLAFRWLRRDRLWALVGRGLVQTEPAPASRFDVAGAVRRLPGSQRAAIVLHYYEDRPVAEIASILGCSAATAKVHLFRGRRRLAQLLGEDPDGI
jgi:RNA polymerase sigma factor (sigma-70 family)